MLTVEREEARRLYEEELYSIQDIADEFSTNYATARKELQKAGVEFREPGTNHKQEAEKGDPEYRDPDVLEELYHGQELSTREIADRYDISYETVTYWMDKHGIDRRDRKEAAERALSTGHVAYRTNHCGYEEWTNSDQSKNRMFVHRLLAIAEHGFDAVAGMDVHHKNWIKWDNRTENIDVLDPSEHQRRHNQQEREMSFLKATLNGGR